MPGRPPLIAVTVGRHRPGGRLMDGADANYARAVRAAGGVPVLVPPFGEAPLPAEAESLIGVVGGLLLSGGGDVDPARYGAVTDPRTGRVDPERDSTETAVLAAALASGLPVLGVCRGMQLLNVHLGGTLHQHLPDLTEVDHQVAEPRNRPAHAVEVVAGTCLAGLVSVAGNSLVQVNSIHHQAVDRPAPGLTVAARAPDGIVEAVEAPDRRILGVQWHPENLVPAPAHLALFEWLVRESSAG